MNPSNEEILEGLRPRMRQARVAHLRRLLAGLAVVPILGLGAVAMAADGGDAPATETAGGGSHDGGDAPDEPAVDLPDIGEAGGDEAPEKKEPEPDPAPEPEKDEDPEEPEEQTKVLSLGELGVAEVAETGEGLELVRTEMVEGWEIVSIDIVEDEIQIVVIRGDKIKMVVITPGVRDEIQARVIDVIIPTTTTTTTTTAKPKPEPVVERFVVEVPGKGAFVVEREGGTLWLGNVEVNEGLDYVVVKAEGPKVWVTFTNGEWKWHGKAFIDEQGKTQIHIWDEPAEVVVEPVYQWVEVGGVGAVQFKLHSNGLIQVVNSETAECCGFYDYNGGAKAEVGKVDFEGEGTLFIVEAWGTESREIVWEIADLSPEPPAEEPPPA